MPAPWTFLSSPSQSNDVGLAQLSPRHQHVTSTSFAVQQVWQSWARKHRRRRQSLLVWFFMRRLCELESNPKLTVPPGAGVGGVATAARLAKAGFKVTVFEKNDFTGGRCSLINHDGYVRHIKCFAPSPQLISISSASTKDPHSSFCLTHFAKPSMISVHP